ncbi:MAG: SNF2-related protein [Acidobacteriota bacterium]
MSRTTLAAVLADRVPSRVRHRGQRYFQQGRVRILACDAQKVEALVSGSARYKVRLVQEGGDVRSTCTCPYFDRSRTCKHIWATVLAADARTSRAERGQPGQQGQPGQAGQRGPRGQRGQRGRGQRGQQPNRNEAAQAPVEGQIQEPQEDQAQTARPAGRQPGKRNPQRRRLPRKGDTTRRPPRRNIPLWMEVLDTLPPDAADLPREALLYEIDEAATREAGRLALTVLEGRKRPDGGWDLVHPLQLRRAEVPELPDAIDRKILPILIGSNADPNRARASVEAAPVPARWDVSSDLAGDLLPLLCETGRCRVRRLPGRRGGGGVLALDEGPPWELWLEVRESSKGGCSVTGSLRRNGKRIPLAEPLLLFPSGWMLTADRASRHNAGEAFSWISLLRGSGALRVQSEWKEDLLERLVSHQPLAQIELPKSLALEEIRPPLRPHVRITQPLIQFRGLLDAEVAFGYEDREIPAFTPGRAIYLKDRRLLLARDSEAERRALEQLEQLDFRPGDGPLHQMKVPQGWASSALVKLLAEGWSVELHGRLYRPPGLSRLSVSSGFDWFDVRGEVDFEGVTVRLPQVLDALRRGSTFLALPDGSEGLIPEDWVKRLAGLADLGKLDGDHLRFQAQQATLLDAWLADQPGVTWDETFDAARTRLHTFEGIVPAEAPAAFEGELRGYQRIGLGWLYFLRELGFGGCLADDMGLGKTVQVLALLEARREAREKEELPPSLVIVPRSLIFNWKAETARFTPKIRILDHTGLGRPREAEGFAGYDVVLTTYGTLRQDIELLRQVEFDYLVLDEAQAIKNASSQTAKAARLLRGRHRLAMSGTPIENHLGELWSLVEFLNPGLLGASALLSTTSEMRTPDAATRELLARALRPFFLRRTKEQVAPELPAKIEQTLICELPPDQRRLYDELRAHYRDTLGAKIGSQGLGRTKILVLEALLRLRQAACHPGLLDPGRADEPCAKLDVLLPQLREIADEGHKALVFSQFTSFLALLRRQLDAEGVPYLYLDGRTRDRQEKVEQFQNDPSCTLFLISLKAGGLGLNLTAADYVYLLDPWWNPAVEAQAIDRAHRIGQTRPVFASRIVAKDTVEEKIVALQKSKRELADAILQADESLIASLSREDLELLLS